MSRPLPDLAAWARYSADLSGVPEDIELADVLDLLHKHLPQPKCDTCAKPHPHAGCDYNAFAVNGYRFCEKCGTGWPCPDPQCEHGLLALDEHLRRVAGVWAAFMIPTSALMTMQKDNTVGAYIDATLPKSGAVVKRVIFDGSVSVEVEIVAVRDSRMEIRYPSGSQVTVPQSWLAPGQHPVLTVVAHEAVVESSTSGLPLLSEAQYRVLRALLMAGPAGLIDDEHLDIHNMAPTSAGKRRLEATKTVARLADDIPAVAGLEPDGPTLVEVCSGFHSNQPETLLGEMRHGYRRCDRCGHFGSSHAEAT